jgi:hypothetical protein
MTEKKDRYEELNPRQEEDLFGGADGRPVIPGNKMDDDLIRIFYEESASPRGNPEKTNPSQ